MTLLHTTAPFWDVWRAWFLSDGVGIVVVAPLHIASCAGTGTHPHLSVPCAASACCNQNRMSISRYIVVAVVKCSRACSRLPVRR